MNKDAIEIILLDFYPYEMAVSFIEHDKRTSTHQRDE